MGKAGVVNLEHEVLSDDAFFTSAENLVQIEPGATAVRIVGDGWPDSEASVVFIEKLPEKDVGRSGGRDNLESVCRCRDKVNFRRLRRTHLRAGPAPGMGSSTAIKSLEPATTHSAPVVDNAAILLMPFLSLG